MDALNIDINPGHPEGVSLDDLGDQVELYVVESDWNPDVSALVHLDRSQATQIRDWLNEWLTGSEVSPEVLEALEDIKVAPEADHVASIKKLTPKRSSEYWII